MKHSLSCLTLTLFMLGSLLCLTDGVATCRFKTIDPAYNLLSRDPVALWPQGMCSMIPNTYTASNVHSSVVLEYPESDSENCEYEHCKACSGQDSCFKGAGVTYWKPPCTPDTKDKDTTCILCPERPPYNSVTRTSDRQSPCGWDCAEGFYPVEVLQSPSRPLRSLWRCLRCPDNWVCKPGGYVSKCMGIDELALLDTDMDLLQRICVFYHNNPWVAFSACNIVRGSDFPDENKVLQIQRLLSQHYTCFAAQASRDAISAFGFTQKSFVYERLTTVEGVCDGTTVQTPETNMCMRNEDTVFTDTISGDSAPPRGSELQTTLVEITRTVENPRFFPGCLATYEFISYSYDETVSPEREVIQFGGSEYLCDIQVCDEDQTVFNGIDTRMKCAEVCGELNGDKLVSVQCPNSVLRANMSALPSVPGGSPTVCMQPRLKNTYYEHGTFIFDPYTQIFMTMAVNNITYKELMDVCCVSTLLNYVQPGSTAFVDTKAYDISDRTIERTGSGDLLPAVIARDHGLPLGCVLLTNEKSKAFDSLTYENNMAFNWAHINFGFVSYGFSVFVGRKAYDTPLVSDNLCKSISCGMGRFVPACHGFGNDLFNLNTWSPRPSPAMYLRDQPGVLNPTNCSGWCEWPEPGYKFVPPPDDPSSVVYVVDTSYSDDFYAAYATIEKFKTHDGCQYVKECRTTKIYCVFIAHDTKSKPSRFIHREFVPERTETPVAVTEAEMTPLYGLRCMPVNVTVPVKPLPPGFQYPSDWENWWLPLPQEAWTCAACPQLSDKNRFMYDMEAYHPDRYYYPQSTPEILDWQVYMQELNSYEFPFNRRRNTEAWESSCHKWVKCRPPAFSVTSGRYPAFRNFDSSCVFCSDIICRNGDYCVSGSGCAKCSPTRDSDGQIFHPSGTCTPACVPGKYLLPDGRCEGCPADHYCPGAVNQSKAIKCVGNNPTPPGKSSASECGGQTCAELNPPRSASPNALSFYYHNNPKNVCLNGLHASPQDLILTYMREVFGVMEWSGVYSNGVTSDLLAQVCCGKVVSDSSIHPYPCICKKDTSKPAERINGIWHNSLTPIRMSCPMNQMLVWIASTPTLIQVSTCSPCQSRQQLSCQPGFFNPMCAGNMGYLDSIFPYGTIGSFSLRYTWPDVPSDVDRHYMVSSYMPLHTGCYGTCPSFTSSQPLSYYTNDGGAGECVSKVCDAGCTVFFCPTLITCTYGPAQLPDSDASGYMNSWYSVRCDRSYGRDYASCELCTNSISGIIGTDSDWVLKNASMAAIRWNAGISIQNTNDMSALCAWTCALGYIRTVKPGIDTVSRCYKCLDVFCGIGMQPAGCNDTTTLAGICGPCVGPPLVKGRAWDWVNVTESGLTFGAPNCNFKCLPGYYKKAGLLLDGSSAMVCELCIAGFYCPTGEGQPRSCDEGYWSTPGSVACVLCDLGYYCPFDPRQGRTDRISCAAELTTPTGGRVRQEGCTCAVGFKFEAAGNPYGTIDNPNDEGFVSIGSDEGGVTVDVVCRPCPPGFYCPIENGTLVGEKPCPLNMTSGIGAKSVSDCYCASEGGTGWGYEWGYGQCTRCGDDEYTILGSCYRCMLGMDSESLEFRVDRVGVESCKCRRGLYEHSSEVNRNIPSVLQEKHVSTMRSYRGDVFVLVINARAVALLFADYDTGNQSQYQLLMGSEAESGVPIEMPGAGNLSDIRFGAITDVALSIDGTFLWVADGMYGLYEIRLVDGTLNSLRTQSSSSAAPGSLLSPTGTVTRHSGRTGIRFVWINLLMNCVHYGWRTTVYMIELQSYREGPVYSVNILASEEIISITPDVSEGAALLRTVNPAGTPALYYIHLDKYNVDEGIVALDDRVLLEWTKNPLASVLEPFTALEFLTVIDAELWIIQLSKIVAGELFRNRLYRPNQWSGKLKRFKGTSLEPRPVHILVGVMYPEVTILAVSSRSSVEHNFDELGGATFNGLRNTSVNVLGSEMRTYTRSCSACPSGMTSSPGSTSIDDCVRSSCPENSWCEGGVAYPCPFGTMSPPGVVHHAGCRCVDGTRPNCVNAFSYMCNDNYQNFSSDGLLYENIILKQYPENKAKTETIRTGNLGGSRFNGATKYNPKDTRTQIETTPLKSGPRVATHRLLISEQGIYFLELETGNIEHYWGQSGGCGSDSWKNNGCTANPVRRAAVDGNWAHVLFGAGTSVYRIDLTRTSTGAVGTRINTSPGSLDTTTTVAEVGSYMRWIDLSCPIPGLIFILSVDGYVVLATSGPSMEFVDLKVLDSDALSSGPSIIPGSVGNTFRFPENPGYFTITDRIVHSISGHSSFFYTGFAWSWMDLKIRVAIFKYQGQYSLGKNVRQVTVLDPGGIEANGIEAATLTGRNDIPEYLVAVTHTRTVYMYYINHADISLELYQRIELPAPFVESLWVDPVTHAFSYIAGSSSRSRTEHVSEQRYMKTSWQFPELCDPDYREDMFSCVVLANATAGNQTIPAYECLPCLNTSQFGYLEECYGCPAGSTLDLNAAIANGTLTSDGDPRPETLRLISEASVSNGVVSASFRRNCVADANRYWDWDTTTVSFGVLEAQHLATCQNNPSLAVSDVDSVYCNDDKRVMVVARDSASRWDSVYLVDPATNAATRILGLTYQEASEAQQAFMSDVADGNEWLHEPPPALDSMSATESATGKIIGLIWATLRWVITVESTPFAVYVRRVIPAQDSVTIVAQLGIEQYRTNLSAVTLDPRQATLYLTDSFEHGVVWVCFLVNFPGCERHFEAGRGFTSRITSISPFVGVPSENMLLACTPSGIVDIRNGSFSMRHTITGTSCTVASSNGDRWVVVEDSSRLYLFDAILQTTVDVVALKANITQPSIVQVVDGNRKQALYTGSVNSIAVTASTDVIFFTHQGVLRRSQAVTRPCPISTSGRVNARSFDECKCLPGYYVNYASVSQDCLPAPVGSYANGVGVFPCPVGATTLGTGSLNISYCFCGPGSILVRANDTSCTLCPYSYYNELVSSSSCLPCPHNSTTDMVGARRISDCICPPGYVPSGNGPCVKCPAATFHPGRLSVTTNVSLLSDPLLACINCSSGRDDGLYNASDEAVRSSYWDCGLAGPMVRHELVYEGTLLPSSWKLTLRTMSLSGVTPSGFSAALAIDSVNNVFFMQSNVVGDRRLVALKPLRGSLMQGGLESSANSISFYPDCSVAFNPIHSMMIGNAPHYFLYVITSLPSADASFVNIIDFYRVRNTYSRIYSSDPTLQVQRLLQMGAFSSMVTAAVCMEQVDLSVLCFIGIVDRPDASVSVHSFVWREGMGSVTGSSLRYVVQTRTVQMTHLAYDSQYQRLFWRDRSGIVSMFETAARRFNDDVPYDTLRVGSLHSTGPFSWLIAGMGLRQGIQEPDHTAVLNGLNRYPYFDIGPVHADVTGLLPGNLYEFAAPFIYHGGKRIAVMTLNETYLFTVYATLDCPSVAKCTVDGVIQCPSNSSRELGGSDTCVCNAGFYQSETLAGNQAAWTCLPCEAGRFCVNGVRYECPWYSSSPSGSVSVFDCQCLRDFYRDDILEAGPMDNPFECVPCPEKSSSNTSGALSVVACRCASGYFMQQASNSPTPCMENCVVGAMNQDMTRMFTGCVIADVGFWAVEGTTLESLGACSRFGVNVSLGVETVPMTTRGQGSKSSMDCVCPERSYQISAEQNVCVRCMDNASAPIASIGINSCDCLPGEFYNQTDCQSCPVGYYCDGTGPPLSCPPGATTRYPSSDTYNDCICLSTHAGEITATCVATNLCCFSCPSNSHSYVENPGVDRSFTVCACNPGYYAAVWTNYFTFSENSANFCQICDANYYCPVVDQHTVRTACPATSWTNGVAGASRLQDCTCKPNHQATQGNSYGEFCVGCPSGSVQVDQNAFSPCSCRDNFYYDQNSLQCTLCPINHFCSGGVKSACPPNSVSNPESVPSISQSNCRCNAGGYIDTRQPSNAETLALFTANEICGLCPGGYYCPGGNIASKCTEPARMSSIGLTDSRTCKPAPGYLAPVTNGRWTICPVGFYCPFTNAGSQQTCGSNSASSAGSFHVDHCTCIAGYYRSNYFCYQCPVGNFCLGHSGPIPCPTNSSSGLGAKQMSECVCSCFEGIASYFYLNGTCTICPEGHVCTGSTVTPCPVGSYCTSTNCAPISCAEGRTTSGVGASSVLQCSCQTGYYRLSNETNATDSECQACEANYACVSEARTQCPLTAYAPPGSVSCQSCPVNSQREGDVIEFGAITDCHSIEGYYAPHGGEMQLCPANYYCPIASQTPSPCPIGSVSMPGSAALVDCRCNDGMYITETQCRDCPVDSFCSNGFDMQQCPGNTTTLGLDRRTSISECFAKAGFRAWGETLGTSYVVECRFNTYCPADNNNDEVFCPALTGHTNTGVASISGCICYAGYITGTHRPGDAFGNCTVCPQHHYCPSGVRSPIPCGENGTNAETRSILTASVSDCSCIPGTYRSPSTPVACDHSQCPYGFKCIACPPGMYCNGMPNATSCPVGSESLAVADNIDDCLPKPGYYMISDAVSGRIFPLCPVGFYCPGSVVMRETGDRDGRFDCQSMSTSMAGSVSIQECVCNDGRYLNNSGLDQRCMNCPANHYCKQNVKTACQANQSSPTLSDSYAQDCVCNVGYYRVFTQEAAGACAECSAGNYCPYGESRQIPCTTVTRAGLPVATSPRMSSDQSQCMPIQGYYFDTTTGQFTRCQGSTVSNGHLTENRGFYCTGTRRERTPCPLGTTVSYSQAGAVTECLCPAGSEPSYDVFAESVTCRPCPVNFYCPAVLGIPPLPCRNGTMTDPAVNGGTGARSANDCYCAPGSRLTQNNACEQCPANNFCGFPNRNGVCPANVTTSLPGSDDAIDCVASPGYVVYYNVGPGEYVSSSSFAADFYSFSGERHVVVKCPTGVTCLGGAVSCPLRYYKDPNVLACVSCPANFYCANSMKQACPGMLTSLFFSDAIEDCVCAVGWMYTGPGLCVPCPANSFCRNGNATSCLNAVSPQNSSEITHCLSNPGYYNNGRNECGAGFYCPGAANGSDTLRLVCHTSSTTLTNTSDSWDDCICPLNTTARLTGRVVRGYNEWACQSVAGYQALGTLRCGYGFYCPYDADEGRLACPGGDATTLTETASAASECTCLVGYYKQGNDCNGCDEAQYCPLGTLYGDNGDGIPRCPLHSSSERYSTAVTNCTCEAGYYGTINETGTGCSQCDTGFFCPGGGSREECPWGDWSLDGAIDASECGNLPGHFSDGQRCPVGFYCPGGFENATRCPNSQMTTPSTGAQSVLDCVCPLGYETTRPYNRVVILSNMRTRSFFVEGKCLKCPVDTYCPFNTSTNGRIPCPDYATAPEGSSELGRCTCVPGYIGNLTSSIGGSNCTRCDPSSYCPGGWEKFPCPGITGTWGIVAISLSDCHPMRAGAQTNGSICPVDKYCNWNGMYDCPVNSTSPEGSKSIHECVCRIGYYPQPHYTQTQSTRTKSALSLRGFTPTQTRSVQAASIPSLRSVAFRGNSVTVMAWAPNGISVYFVSEEWPDCIRETDFTQNVSRVRIGDCTATDMTDEFNSIIFLTVNPSNIDLVIVDRTGTGQLNTWVITLWHPTEPYNTRPVRLRHQTGTVPQCGFLHDIIWSLDDQTFLVCKSSTLLVTVLLVDSIQYSGTEVAIVVTGADGTVFTSGEMEARLGKCTGVSTSNGPEFWCVVGSSTGNWFRIQQITPGARNQQILAFSKSQKLAGIGLTAFDTTVSSGVDGIGRYVELYDRGSDVALFDSPLAAAVNPYGLVLSDTTGFVSTYSGFQVAFAAKSAPDSSNYIDAHDVSGPFSCVVCPVDHYCPPNRVPVQCPENEANAVVPVFGNLSDCVCSKPGTYSNAGVCEMCAEDHYCTGDTTKVPCPTYTVSLPRIGASSIDQCEQTVGYFYNSTSGQMQECPPNSYCLPGFGLGVVPCPAYSSAPGMSNRPEHCVCQDGRYYRDGNTSACVLCDADSYCAGGVRSECIATRFSPVGSNNVTACVCGPGSRTVDISSEVQSPVLQLIPCIPCEAWSYCPVGDTQIPCPLYYIAVEGSTRLSECQMLTGYCDADSHGGANATLCPLEYYCPRNITACLPCPPGHTTFEEGASKASQCVCAQSTYDTRNMSLVFKVTQHNLTSQAATVGYPMMSYAEPTANFIYWSDGTPCLFQYDLDTMQSTRYSGFCTDTMCRVSAIDTSVDSVVNGRTAKFCDIRGLTGIGQRMFVIDNRVLHAAGGLTLRSQLLDWTKQVSTIQWPGYGCFGVLDTLENVLDFGSTCRGNKGELVDLVVYKDTNGGEIVGIVSKDTSSSNGALHSYGITVFKFTSNNSTSFQFLGGIVNYIGRDFYGQESDYFVDFASLKFLIPFITELTYVNTSLPLVGSTVYTLPPLNDVQRDSGQYASDTETLHETFYRKFELPFIIEASERERGEPLACEACPAGFYCQVTDNTATLTPCPPNSMSEANSTSIQQCICIPGHYKTATQGCLVCPPGSYCNGGSHISNCTTRMTSATGSRLFTDCLMPIGYYDFFLVASCPANHYCVGGPIWDPIQCPEHATAPPGSSTVVACVCPAGYYAANFSDPSTGVDTNDCLECPANFYCSNERLDQCPYFSTSGNMSSVLGACICEPGRYLVGAACDLCGYGAYCDGNLRMLCPLHSTTSLEVSNSESDCICSSGLFKNATNHCQICPVGSYCPGDNSARLCGGLQSSQPGSALVSQCLCPVGMYTV